MIIVINCSSIRFGCSDFIIIRITKPDKSSLSPCCNLRMEKCAGKFRIPMSEARPSGFVFPTTSLPLYVDLFVTRIASVQIGVALMAICPSFRVGTCMETRASGFRVTCGILRLMKMLSAGISYIRSSPQSNITHTFRQTCFACWLNWFSNAEDAQNRHFDLRMN